VPAVDICDFSGPPDIAIVHLNPDGWPGVVSEGVLSEAHIRVIESAASVVGIWVWETDSVPESWAPAFERVDCIWVPSCYCADVFRAKAKVPVDIIPHVVTVPPTVPDSKRVQRTKRRLGLAESKRVVLYAFDGSSYLARKNPFALVRAFDRTGLSEKGWQLILKTKHLFDQFEQGRILTQLVKRVRGAVLIDRPFSKEKMDELMAATDIYASPHSSEGFGLTIAEAMASGKIVIATDYGGSRDLLTAACGLPVRYHLQAIEDDHGPYARRGVWAQVDEDHLAQSMLAATALVDAGDGHLGDAARARVKDLLSPRAVGAAMCDSLTQLLNRV
jgi:glycosyltransferase involved in cell wall biosynthesis